MPKIITNKNRTPVVRLSATSGFCVSSYQEYVAQRVEVSDSHENIEQLTSDYKMKISNPIKAMNPNIEMGEYFVVPVTELRKMLDSADQPDFVHICNAVRDTTNDAGKVITFPVSILVPVKKVMIDGEAAHEICNSVDSVYVETFPCPPHPNCPNTRSLIENIFKPGTVLNNFSSLL